MSRSDYKCPVCSKVCALIDSVDFNKSCEDKVGKGWKPSGKRVDYYLCPRCGFCFAPEISGWSIQEFEEKIYNKDYIKVDPEYLRQRPQSNFAALMTLFGAQSASLRHLDYGGGNGMLSKLLKAKAWNTVSYDPFVNKDVDVRQLGAFDLISAMEVFEHVPDVNALMSDLSVLLSENGVVYFSTFVSDKFIKAGNKLDWWYAAPRNGHISLFSRRSLIKLAKKHRLNFGSFNDNLHLLWKSTPHIGSHLLEAPPPKWYKQALGAFLNHLKTHSRT